jgi:glucose/arabinose dehydrogenase
VSSFLASTAHPDVADPASERLILSVPHPTFTNHNGGRLAFGPDGYLYIGMGDGGSSGDPPNNAQSLSTLLGKLLRVDIDTPEGYAIPPDNPFVGVSGARGEIWAYGLRNPWKFSFDRVTGDLYIGDVGQNRIEEIDFVPYGTAPGLNFGWRVFEGADCFNPSAGCALSGHRPPIIQYAHDAAGGESVTGGYAYRGYRSAALRGYYFYGDFISSRVWAAVREGTSWRTSVVFEPPGPLSGVSTFGEDEAGEILVASYNDGRVYAIQGLAPGVNPVNRFEYNSAGQPILSPWHRRMR